MLSAVNRVIVLRNLSEVCGICIHLTLNCTEPQCWTWILLKPILYCHAICYWYQMPCLLNFAQYANKLGQYLSWWWHVAYPVPSRHQGKCLLIEIQWDKLRIVPINWVTNVFFLVMARRLSRCQVITWANAYLSTIGSRKHHCAVHQGSESKLVLVLAWRLFDDRPLPNQLFYMSLNVLVR